MKNYLASNLKFLRKKKGVNQTEVASVLDFKRNTLSNWESEYTEPGLDKLGKLARYFDITIDELVSKDLANAHLISGSAEIKTKEIAHPNAHPSAHLSPKITVQDHDPPYQAQEAKIVPVVVTIDSHGRDNITLVPVKARAGYMLGYGDPKFIKTLPVYRLPGLNNGTFRAFEVEGLSMYNTFSPGDIVIGSYVELAQHCRDERVYIFVTKEDGILIKRAINRAEKEGKFILKSDNITDRDQYPVTVLPVDKIAEIWYVEAVLSKNLRAPSSIYGRLTDLEARMAILEDSGHKKGAKSKLK